MQIFRAFVNWIVVLTLPLWGGFVMFLVFLFDLVDGDEECVSIATGKESFFDF